VPGPGPAGRLGFMLRHQSLLHAGTMVTFGALEVRSRPIRAAPPQYHRRVAVLGPWAVGTCAVPRRVEGDGAEKGQEVTPVRALSL
jgi:hypothetical protein